MSLDKQYYQNQFNRNLDRGKIYEDFMKEYLRLEHAIFISTFSSSYYQGIIGESAQGIEIKFDSRFPETGNLFIETKERTNPNENYKDSGIYRDDNTIIYLIGNTEIFFMFFREKLIAAAEYSTAIEIPGRTAWGFLYPVVQAENLGLKLSIDQIKYKDLIPNILKQGNGYKEAPHDQRNNLPVQDR